MAGNPINWKFAVGMMQNSPGHRFPIWQVVALSFFLQVAAIGLLQTYRFRTTDNNFAFGWEMGCIGRALASGRGFSDPFCIGAGPTAWEPPLYPTLIGGVFKVFGIRSTASAWILLGINSLFSALTCIPIYFVARRVAGEKVARRACWTWGLLPYAWYWAIHWVWDTTITPFVLSLIILVSMKLEEWEGPKGWIWFGLLWGLGVLLNPSLAAFLPFCGLWIWHRRRRKRMPSLGGALLASILFILFLSPWLVRNYRTFGSFVFVRSNLAQELWLGNGPMATGVSRVYLMPNRNAAELEKLKEKGEMPYLEEQKRKAIAFISQNPGEFLRLCAKRVVYFWSGVPRANDGLAVTLLRTSLFAASSLLAIWGLIMAAHRGLPGAWLLILLTATYPVAYYVVYPHARYRHPIEPAMVIAIVYLVSEWAKRSRRMKSDSVL